MMAHTRDWEFPDPDTILDVALHGSGGLLPAEELSIAAAPRPLKSKRQQTLEQEWRAARADTRRNARDPIPWKITERSLVDAAGMLEFAEAFLRYVDGAPAVSTRDAQMQQVLREMERTSRIWWAILLEIHEYQQSLRGIAEKSGVSYGSIRKMWVAAILYFRQRYTELYAPPHDAS